MREAIRRYSVDCYGVTYDGKPALDSPTPVTVSTVDEAGNRVIECPLFRAGKCGAVERLDDRTQCMLEVQEQVLFDNKHIISPDGTASPSRQQEVPIYRAQGKLGISSLPEITNSEPSLLASQYKELVNIAHGYTSDESAEKQNISNGSVRSQKRNIYNKLGANNNISAVLLALDKGILDPKDVVDEVDLEKVLMLTLSQRQVLDVMIADNGVSSEVNQIAAALNITAKAVRSRLEKIRKTLDVKKNASAACYWKIAKERIVHEDSEKDTVQEKAITLTPAQHSELVFMAQGYSARESGERQNQSKRSIRTRRSELMKKLGTHKDIPTVLTALERGLLKSEEVIDAQKHILLDHLNSIQRDILEAITENNGIRSSYRQISDRLGIPFHIVHKNIDAIHKILEVNSTVEAVVLYQVTKY